MFDATVNEQIKQFDIDKYQERVWHVLGRGCRGHASCQ